MKLGKAGKRRKPKRPTRKRRPPTTRDIFNTIIVGGTVSAESMNKAFNLINGSEVNSLDALLFLKKRLSHSKTRKGKNLKKRSALPSSQKSVILEAVSKKIVDLEKQTKNSSSGVEEHGQITVYKRILEDPDYYASLREDDLHERIELILSGMDTFNGRVKRAAEFNIQFYQAALDKRAVDKLKLIDDTGYFKWPNTIVNKWNDYRNVLLFDGGDHGVLSRLGYTARIDGPSTSRRRNILDRLFKGHIRLPLNLPLEYLESWGAPNTSFRLRKMARTLASFCRLQKGKEDASDQAIEKWEADLLYLKESYYKPFQKQFDWPSS